MDGSTRAEAAPHVKVRRIGGNIGAEISGVDLGRLSDAEFAVIHDALVSSMTAAYAGLSEPMKRYIHGMEALHDFKPWRPLFTSSEAHQKKLREIEAKWPPQWHPVVRVHPISGRRILNVQAQFCVK